MMRRKLCGFVRCVCFVPRMAVPQETAVLPVIRERNFMSGRIWAHHIRASEERDRQMRAKRCGTTVVARAAVLRLSL